MGLCADPHLTLKGGGHKGILVGELDIGKAFGFMAHNFLEGRTYAGSQVQAWQAMVVVKTKQNKLCVMGGGSFKHVASQPAVDSVPRIYLLNFHTGLDQMT